MKLNDTFLSEKLNLNDVFSSKYDRINFITKDENEVKESISKVLKNIDNDNNVFAYLKTNYKSDKEFNKVLMFRFVNFLKTFIKVSDDYTFISISTYLQYEGLDKLLLQLLYKEDLDSATRIKMIKNFEIRLPFLIYNEKLIYDKLKYIDKLEEYRDDEPEDPKMSKKYIMGLSTYLNLIRVIKTIKFGLGKADIAYFDKNNKEKKVFKSYKTIATAMPHGVIKLFTRDLIDYNYLSKYVTHSEFINEEDYRLGVMNEMICSPMEYENNREYVKLLLGSEYNSIITNPMLHNKSNTTEGFIEAKVLNRRKVLVPRGGVVLKVEGDSDIDSILIREIENEFDNNLVIVTRDRLGDEWVNSFILSSSLEIGQVFIEKRGLNFTTLDYIFDFLGVLDEDTIKKRNERNDSLGKELSYEVISPYYWKYRGLYTAPEDKVDFRGTVTERAYKVDISHFIRKTNGEAGEEAKKLAKRLCVELEEGQTIVRAHTRQYKRKILVK